MIVPIMQGARIKAIRQAASLSLSALAKLLRMKDKSTIHRWENGDRSITGPSEIIMEMIERGELPARYFPTKGQEHD